ncbi:MAG: patatin-like phospholipase family protein [Campylobacteraceae bacterium]|nr:patatin-like phospholipase family protein [Campylobacteraceae bacterium]
MNLALVLSGGGAKGAFHLGALKFLEEEKINIAAYSGTSIGSIISCSHASGVKADDILKIFKSKEIKKLIKFNYFKKGLMRIDTNKSIIKDLFPYENIEDIKKPVFINAYDIKHKQMHYFNKGNIINLCMASSALIPFFKPITYHGMSLIDGGLIDNIPVKPFINKDYKILSFDVMPRKKRSNKINLNPIKFIKKRIFKDLHKNITYSIQHSDYYLSHLALRQFKLLSFNNLDECYNLGYTQAQIQLKLFIKEYKL